MNNYKTERLLVDKLKPGDAEFIRQLVNTQGWLKFIGDRNVKTSEDALLYVERIMKNPHVNYWVVKLKEQQIPIGIITFIKRDYLDHHDIGFAFLENYGKKGYALEAAREVLKNLIKDKTHTHILATTTKENKNSINLLQKLGLQFDREVMVDKAILLLYSATTNQLQRLLLNL